MSKGKKIYVTESQLKRFLMKEMTLSGDDALATTHDPKAAAQKTIDGAQTAGVDTNSGVQVSFSADALRKNAGISEATKPLTKKQLQEARLKYLKENSVCIPKFRIQKA